MSKVLNGDNPLDELSSIITTLRHDVDHKIRRLADALATLGVAASELEKVRIALEGTAPSAFVSTIAHDTCIQIPAQVVTAAKKHEIMHALEAAADAFDAVRESVNGVLDSASLPNNKLDAHTARRHSAPSPAASTTQGSALGNRSRSYFGPGCSADRRSDGPSNFGEMAAELTTAHRGSV